MDEQVQDGDAGVANHSNAGLAGDANNSTAGDAVVANQRVAAPSGDTGGTGQDVTAAIAGKITYSLTIDDAQKQFADARRRVPSGRSLQRYCEEGLIKGIRQSVTYDDGTHAKPWFINENLDSHIKKQPIVVLGDDGDANGGAKVTTWSKNGDAGDANDPVATPSHQNGVANNEKRDREVQPPVSPIPEPPPIPVSEILLENARLQERLEGRNEVIKRIEEGYDRERKEWHSERDFLRTDVTETRALVRDMQSHADGILETFKQIGTKQQEQKVEADQIVYRPVQNGGNPTGEPRPL